MPGLAPGDSGERLSWYSHEHLDSRGSGLERKTLAAAGPTASLKQGQLTRECGNPPPATSGHHTWYGDPSGRENWSNLSVGRENHGVHASSLLLLLCHMEKMVPGSSLRWAAESRDDRQTETGEDPSGDGMGKTPPLCR